MDKVSTATSRAGVQQLAETPERLIKIDGGYLVVHDAATALGKRDDEQENLFVTEAVCARFYARKMGRLESVPPAALSRLSFLRD